MPNSYRLKLGSECGLRVRCDRGRARRDRRQPRWLAEAAVVRWPMQDGSARVGEENKRVSVARAHDPKVPRVESDYLGDAETFGYRDDRRIGRAEG